MNYTVTFQELRDAGSGIVEASGTVAGVRTQLDGVPLSQPDFGRIPWLQTRVWEAFDEHTAECKEAAKDLEEIIKAAGEGLQHTADAYESYEDDVVAAIDEFFGEI